MSRTADPLRASPALLFTACALCALAQFLVVLPELQKLDLLRARANELLESGAAATRIPVTSPQAISRVRAQLDTDLENLRRRVSGPASESEMFSAMSRAASAHQVRLDNMTPGQTESAPAGSAATPAKQILLQLTASGTYQNLSAFIADIESNFGLSEIVSMRLSDATSDDGSTIRAELRVRHVVLPGISDVAVLAHPGANERSFQ